MKFYVSSENGKAEKKLSSDSQHIFHLSLLSLSFIFIKNCLLLFVAFNKSKTHTHTYIHKNEDRIDGRGKAYFITLLASIRDVHASVISVMRKSSPLLLSSSSMLYY
jgi:hypothetical protein